jgi:long-subunit acyl-CoA synthetase (AMP-forming)
MTHSFFTDLRCHAEKHPDQAALTDSSGELSWSEMLQQIDHLTDRLSVEAGQRIALMADNSIHWILTDLAATKLGRVLVPLPLFFSDAQTRHVLASAGIDTLITVERSGPVISRIKPASQPALLPGTAKITFTSGTTGSPKGVCLSVDNQFNLAYALRDRLAGLELKSHLCALPLATLLENVAGVYSALLMGACVHLPELASLGFGGSSRLDVEPYFSTLQRLQPDSFITLPQVLSLLTEHMEANGHSLSSLRFVAVGGARVGTSLLRRAHACGLPAYEGYGLSEAGSVVSLNTPDQQRLGSAGYPLSHVGIETDGSGELIIRGNTMLGYLGSEPCGELFHTGDIGSIRLDGQIQISGRSRNVIINSFGRNLSPEWVESDWLARPGVEQAVLFGEARPYNALLIHAPTLTDTEIENYRDTLNRDLPDYAQVGAWYRLPEPLTPEQGFYTLNGRPRRDRIAQQFEAEIDSLYPLLSHPLNSLSGANRS